MSNLKEYFIITAKHYIVYSICYICIIKNYMNKK